MRHLTVPVIAGLMVLVGLYFFPLGEDIVFKAILDFAGGDYWLARMYQYIITGALIVTGVLLLKYGRGVPVETLFVGLMLVVVAAYLVVRG